MITLKFFKYSIPFEQRQFEYFVRKGLDLSSYVSISSNLTTALDGTISRYAIDLIGYTTDVEFEPTTKFVLDIYEDYNLVKSIDMVLQDDVVEKPIMSDNNYYIHHLSLADPAILAQQRTCDNFAITYKLKDVNLSTTEVINTTSTIEDTGDYAQYGIAKSYYDLNAFDNYDSYVNNFGINTYSTSSLTIKRELIAYKFEWKQPTFTFITPTNITVSYNDNIALKTLKKNYVNTNQITFDVPMIMCSVSEQNYKGYQLVGYLPVDVLITRYNHTNNTTSYYDNENKTWSVSEVWNTSAPSETLQDNYFKQTLQQGNFGLSGDEVYWRDGLPTNSILYWNSSSATVGQNETNIFAKQVIEESYDTDYIDSETNLPMNRRIVIPVDTGCTYSIKLKRHTYTSDLEYFFNHKTITTRAGNSTQTTERLNRGFIDTNAKLEISTGEINIYAQSTTETPFLRSANVNNCYFLFKKAVFCTYFAKYDNTTPMDMKTPIDVDSDTRELLEKTPIIENMYQQKNLWEIITEIGNYIHAKPYMVFDIDALDDDFVDSGRCLVKFIKYGNMEQSNTLGTRNTIFNSKFVEEYISSLDCYVDNLMQLGSTITEVVVPSSESEDYLVYNDNAILKTKYPILEITKLEILKNDSNAYSSSNWKDITDYVYEYNVWKCLGIDSSVVPNRSIAIYYHLGEKKIEGMQYLIPSLHSTQQYPIKKIIGDVYSMSTADMVNVVVNEYAFRITYRTKDSVRTRVVRPDIRKYIQNNTFDYMPIHTQFRNQTDKIVDSEKYGDNVYGELIRTGNRVVEENRWTYTINDINSIGDLVKLDDDNLYYVSKVETMVYPDHYESNIEYTKDFNRLAQIIGIPSEPRFYEISEQSMIRREININFPVCFYTDSSKFDNSVIMLSSGQASTTTIFNLIFYDNTKKYNRAKIVYEGVYKNYDTDSNDFSMTVYTDVLWSIQNTTLTFEFDMTDNFMVDNTYGEAGFTYPNGFWSFIDYCYNNGQANQQAYYTLNPIRYTDVYGRADTCTIELGFNKFTADRTYSGTNANAIDVVRNNAQDANSFQSTSPRFLTSQMVLLKDNREALSFNINLSFITDSDRNIVSNKIWKLNDYSNINVYREYTDIRLIFFYSQELSKQKSTIDKVDCFDTGLPFSADALSFNDFLTLPDEKWENLTAIAFCYDNGDGTYTFFLGRNVSGLSLDEIKKDWNLNIGRFKQE